MSIFEHPVTLDLIPVCDSILYRTLTDILLPFDLMEMPEKLLREIQNMALHWKNWLECSLENMPAPLKELKSTQGKRFSNALKRHIAFLHLSQVTLPVLNKFKRLSLNRELDQIEERQILHDWVLNIDSYAIKYLLPTAGDNAQIISWLQSLLESEYFIEKLIGWLDDLVRRIVQHTKEVTETARCSTQQLIYILNKISYLLTEKESRNFITFHLFAALIQEYLLLAFENQQYQEKENLLNAKLKKHLNTAVYNTDYLKSPSSCFLVTSKKELNNRQKAQEKILKGASLCGVQNKLNWKHNSESSHMSSRDQNNFWKADYGTSKFPEMNFVKNDMRLPDFSLQQTHSEFNNRDCSAVNIMHKFQPTCTMTNLPLTEMQSLLSAAGGMPSFPEPWMLKELDYDYSLTNDDILKS